MKLHELLPIESSHETQAAKVKADLANTFEKKRHLFEEKRTVFTPSQEGAPAVTETQSDLNTTVLDQLDELTPFLVKSLDASYQVAVANTKAQADVVLDDGKAILKGVPATALLELEKRVASILELLKAIPTLDPAKGYLPDGQKTGKGVYKARDVRKVRTRKTFVPLVLAAATKEHPAQVKEGWEDLPIGHISEQEWSGLLTPADKSKLIDRAEEVCRAIRSARARANEQEVDKTAKIGAALLKHILG
jgi:hypothetical protein